MKSLLIDTMTQMKLKIILASAVVALGIVGGYVFPIAKDLSLGQALPQAVAVFETSLASPISTSATSMTLTANSVRGGSTLSGFNCFTVDEGSAQAEFICGTVSGTTVSSLQRGIDPATGTSTVSALQFAHRRGANVKITDFPLITILRNQANGVETFPNLLSYADTVSIGVGSPTTTITTKAYVDGVAVAGASNGDESTKGIWEGATALEQASSTILGSTAAGLVMQSRYATDTPLSGCASGFTSTAGAGCSVIATLAGKIKQTWLNLTEAFTVSGAWTFNTATTTFNAGFYSNASSTMNATTTFASGVIGVVDVQEFTASSSWVKPTGVSSSSMMMIELWGGGGGGGGVTNSNFGGGGGGGSYLRHYMPTSNATSTVFCRVASGGAGGANGTNNGVVGENTTFGTYGTAYGGGGGGYGDANGGSSGGGGGITGAGGTGSTGGGVVSGGGYGAITTGSQDGYAGGFGSAYNGSTVGNSVFGGGGGGSDAGGAGDSVYGGGGGGKGNEPVAGTSVYGGAGGAGATLGNNGNNGSAPSGGGGGAYSNGSPKAGGNGARGQCRITTWK